MLIASFIASDNSVEFMSAHEILHRFEASKDDRVHFGITCVVVVVGVSVVVCVVVVVSGGSEFSFGASVFSFGGLISDVDSTPSSLKSVKLSKKPST